MIAKRGYVIQSYEDVDINSLFTSGNLTQNLKNEEIIIYGIIISIILSMLKLLCNMIIVRKFK